MAERANPGGPGFAVRRATPADLEAVAALWRDLAAYQDPWRVFPPRSAIDEEVLEQYRRALSEPGSVLVVAEADGRVVGSAFGHALVPSTFSDERAVELSGVVVAPAHRRRGIGRALAVAVGRFAETAGVRVVVVKTFARNGPAVAFWERIGFEPRMVQMVVPAARLASALAATENS